MRSISFRLTLWYAVAATFTAAVFLFVGRFALENSYVAGIDDLNSKEFEEIEPRIREVAPGDIDGVVAAVLEHTEIDASLFFFQIGRDDTSIFFTSSNMAGHRLPAEVHGLAAATVRDKELGVLRVSEFKVNGYDLHIGSSLQGWETLNSRLLRITGLILGFVFLASLAIGYFLSRMALNPIAAIERTANRIGVGNLSERIEIPNTGDELARLTVFLNELFDRLEGAVLQAQRFAADASHEMKTPLSLLRLRTEAMLSSEGVLTEKGRGDLIEQLDDIERLGKVVDELLLLAKSEAGVLKQNIVEHSTSGFLNDFAEDARALCEDSGIVFELVDGGNGIVSFDEIWIRHTLFNLLSNALRFSKSGKTISLLSQVEDEHWFLCFEDEGPGVDESKLAKIFDRFYSDSMGEMDTGSGLGLALCRSIVIQHRGTIRASNRKDRSGLRIEIRIPLGLAR